MTEEEGEGRSEERFSEGECGGRGRYKSNRRRVRREIE